ncbi:hypothetical protein LI90_2833 [Carbonactinospora thermoautotrophica]|uniref:Copper resistance protein D domain-containing protein n=1 Tax=Carbonactinospora thermoautotrophica TaxID=1469144 RepID=A0A132MVB8_9ACTN|nr:hypothetical protein LI90_2833 [Carbonactinospora thermoautotrophica]
MVLGGLVAWHLVQGAAPAWAHAAEQHPPTVEWATVAARCAVLVGGAVVAGVALLRPLAGRPNRARHTVVWTAAAVAAAGSVLSILQGVRPSAALTQAAAIAAVPVLLRWRIAAVPAGALLLALLAGQSTPALWSPAFLVGIVHAVGAAVWLGAAVCVATGPRRTLLGRLAPASVVAGVAVAGTGLAQAYQDGIGLDERLYGTAFGRLLLLKSLVLLGCAAVGVLALRRKLPTAPVFRAEATVLAVAVVAGGVVATIPVPDPPPTPGVPLLREVTLADHRVPVLVTPHRPGWNLVHLGGEGTLGATVRTSPASPPVPAEERAGAPGRWALVELPAGRSTLRIEYYGQSAKVPVDTGHDRTAPAAITGPDGPECASMALGAAVAGARTPLLSCPSDRLDDRDAASLRALVGFLAHRGVPALTLVADASPRGTAAARAVGQPPPGTASPSAPARARAAPWSSPPGGPPRPARWLTSPDPTRHEPRRAPTWRPGCSARRCSSPAWPGSSRCGSTRMRSHRCSTPPRCPRASTGSPRRRRATRDGSPPKAQPWRVHRSCTRRPTSPTCL